MTWPQTGERVRCIILQKNGTAWVRKGSTNKNVNSISNHGILRLPPFICPWCPLSYMKTNLAYCNPVRFSSHIMCIRTGSSHLVTSVWLIAKATTKICSTTFRKLKGHKLVNVVAACTIRKKAGAVSSRSSYAFMWRVTCLVQNKKISRHQASMHRSAFALSLCHVVSSCTRGIKENQASSSRKT